MQNYLDRFILVPNWQQDMVFFVTDTEAAVGVLTEVMRRAAAKVPNARGIFGGDICDKGPDSIIDLDMVLNSGKFLGHIGGNRDINKCRMLEVFSSEFVEGFASTHNAPPFWASKEVNSPLTFLKELGLSVEAYQSLPSYEDKQVVVAKWILSKTMGAPQAFTFKKEALSKILKISTADIDDKLVLRFFIEELILPEQKALLLSRGMLMGEGCKPRGYDNMIAAYESNMYRYLINAKLMIIDGVNFYAHSIFPANIFPYLLSGAKVASPSENGASEHFVAWVNALNQEYLNNLQNYYEYVFENISKYSSSNLVTTSGVIKHPLVLTSLPSGPENQYAIVSSNYPSLALAAGDINQSLQPIANLLKQAGLKTVYIGHNPQVQVMPVYRHVECDEDSSGIDFVFCDTGRPPHNPAVPAFSINFANGCHVTVSEQFEGDSRQFLRLGREVELDGMKYLINSVTPMQPNIERSYVLIQQGVVSPGFLTDPLQGDVRLELCSTIDKHMRSDASSAVNEAETTLSKRAPSFG